MTVSEGEIQRSEEGLMRARAATRGTRAGRGGERDRLLVLDHDGELGGYALFATTSDGARSWVLALGVDPGIRGLGYGRRLMAEGLRRLADDDVREVIISVAPDNAAACGLYESLGFVQVDHRVDYFGTGGDRLIMRMSLPG